MSNTTFNQNQPSNGNLADTSSFADKTKDQAYQASAEANSLAGEAKAAVNDLGDRAKQGVSDAAEHLRTLAEEQKSAGAERFKGYAGSIHNAADSLNDEMPMVANFAHKAADEIEHLADAVKDRDLSDLVGVVHDYARRQPAVFLGATALAGFVVARFLTTSAQKRTQQTQAGEWRNDQREVGAVRPRPTPYTPS